VDAKGDPVWFNGASGWYPLTEISREDLAVYLDDRQARGFNALLLAIPVPPGYGGTADYYGNEPFADPDYYGIDPVEAYWKNADHVLQQADLHGMTCFVVVTYLGYGNDVIAGDTGWGTEMANAEAAAPGTMRAFGQWLGTRYLNQPNIVWVHGGDTNAHDRPGQFELLNSLAEGLASVDTVHLMTAHTTRSQSAYDCYPESWLDLDTSYSYASRTADSTSARIYRDYDRGRPTVFLEGRYEYEADSRYGLGDWSPLVGRKQFYWSLLGGEQGHFYGNGRIWDFCAQGEGLGEGSTCPTDVTNVSWQTALSSPGTQEIEFGNRLRLSRPWQLLVPDYANSVLLGNRTPGDSNYGACAASSDSTFFIVYRPSSGSFNVDMTRIKGKTARAWYFNPTTATKGGAPPGTAVDARDAGGNGPTFSTLGTRTFETSSGDWILVVEEDGAYSNPPGVPLRRTATFVSSFTLSYTEDVVEVRWTIREWKNGGEFRLTASRGTEQWEVAVEPQTGPDFVAVDRSSQLAVGGAIHYQLSFRSPGEDWVTLGEQAISIGARHGSMQLFSPYPNPATGRLVIPFSIGRGGRVQLTVYDMAGRLVARIFEGSLRPGTGQWVWPVENTRGAPVAAGVYLVRLTTAEGVQTRKVVLLERSATAH
jgi:hypothetical protein